MTIEETTSTQWLYVELKDYVEKLVVCDPYRNKLLREGAKNDDIDAGKLSILLRGGFLKEGYHTEMEESYMIRKLISSYKYLIKRGVRLKNQHSLLYSSMGLSYKKKGSLREHWLLRFIEKEHIKAIEDYEEVKKKYKKEFEYLRNKIRGIDYMCNVSGIDTISSVDCVVVKHSSQCRADLNPKTNSISEYNDTF